MFRKSAPALVRHRPPFASFFKALSGPITKKTPRRMQTAAVLWRRTAPKYGSRFCAPRVTAALSVFRRECKHISKEVDTVSKRVRKPSASSVPKPLQSASTKRKTISVKRKAVSVNKTQRPKKRGVVFFAAFQKAVLRRTKLPLTEANRKRVLRVWALTGQQRYLSSQKRVDLAVRLLKKLQKPVKSGRSRRLSKKISKRRITPASSASAKGATRRGNRKRVKSVKSHTASLRLKRAVKARPTRKIATRNRTRALKNRVARISLKRRRISGKGNTRRITSAKSPLVKHKTTKGIKFHKRSISNSASLAKRAGMKSRKAHLGVKPKRVVETNSVDTARRRRNPYIRFYRHMCMTGLIPNHPKGQASRQIKALWTETHALKGLNQRIARATELLEKRTGSKSMIPPPRVTLPTHGQHTPQSRPTGTAAALKGMNLSTLKEKDIKVPSYYNRNPFGATYAALLPAMQDVPSSTRMAQVAKAWTLTNVKDDKRSAKARIAAVAEALKK